MSIFPIISIIFLIIFLIILIEKEDKPIIEDENNKFVEKTSDLLIDNISVQIKFEKYLTNWVRPMYFDGEWKYFYKYKLLYPSLHINSQEPKLLKIDFSLDNDISYFSDFKKEFNSLSKINKYHDKQRKLYDEEINKRKIYFNNQKKDTENKLKIINSGK